MDNNTQTTEKKNEWVAVDPRSLGQGTFSEKVQIDPKGNTFAIVPYVDDGKYAFVLGPSNDPKVPTIQARHFDAKDGKPAMNVLKVNLTLTAVAPADGRDKSVVEGRLKTFTKSFSTFSRKDSYGRPTNEVASLLSLLGVALPAETDAETLAATLAQIAGSGQAMIGDSTVWKAGFERDDKDANDRGEWKLIGQRNFPLAPGGVVGQGPYNPVATIDGTDYRAKAYLRGNFFSLQQR